METHRQVEVRGTPVHLVTGGHGPALLYAIEPSRRRVLANRP